MRRVIVLGLLAACGSGEKKVAEPEPPPEAVAEAEPEPEPVVVDEGEFSLSIDGKAIGSEKFSIVRQGDLLSLQNQTAMALGGQSLKVRGTLVTDEAYRPLEGKFVIDAGGETVEARVYVDGELLVQEMAGEKTPASGPVDLLVSNNVMVHLTPLCAVEQAKQLTVFPGAVLAVEAPARVELVDPTASLPQKRGFGRVTATLAGQLRLELLCDGARLVAVAAPVMRFLASRAGEEGYAASLMPRERAKPPTPPELVELERKVTVEGGSLACTLLLPTTHAKVQKRSKKGKTRALPAVVFITGSGPQDRDADSPGPGGLKLSLFKVMAVALAQAGVASLRCDDRGVGGSTGDLNVATLAILAADVRAQLQLLAKEPAIDPARLGLIGHSEGAVVAPMVAAAEPALVVAVALLAGPGRPLDVLVLEQVEAMMRRGGATDADIDEQLARLAEIFAALRAGSADKLTAQEKITWDTPWWRSHLAHDPAATARQLSKPAIFLAQGGRDVQVRLADSEALNEAFIAAGNKRVRYEIYPELNHLFAHTATGDVADYFDPDAQLDARFLGHLVEFFTRSL